MSPTHRPSARARLGSAWQRGRWLLLGGATVWLVLSYLVQPGGLLPLQLTSPGQAADRSVHIRLAGEDYCLPVNYLNGPLEPGLDQRDILIVALLPDLEGRNRENSREIMRARGFGRHIHVLVNTVGDPFEGVAHGYHAFSRYGPFERIGQAFGLVVMSNDDRSRFGRRELYVHSSGDLRSGFIQCRLPGDVRSPSCRHTFVASERFMVVAVYGRAFLSEWQSIVERIERLFEGFRARSDCRGGAPR